MLASPETEQLGLRGLFLEAEREGASEAARQLASRARENVRDKRPRFALPKEHGFEIAEAFHVASRSGDVATLRNLLAADVEIHADGGGKRPATFRPIIGIENALKLYVRFGQLQAQRPSQVVAYRMINGLPGIITREVDGLLQTTALQIEDGKITGVYVMRNPDKLHHIERAGLH
jgi:RNA polymerase sigma-70 factor (ECF subfamily)